MLRLGLGNGEQDPEDVDGKLLLYCQDEGKS